MSSTYRTLLIRRTAASLTAAALILTGPWPPALVPTLRR